MKYLIILLFLIIFGYGFFGGVLEDKHQAQEQIQESAQGSENSESPETAESINDLSADDLGTSTSLIFEQDEFLEDDFAPPAKEDTEGQ